MKHGACYPFFAKKKREILCLITEAWCPYLLLWIFGIICHLTWTGFRKGLQWEMLGGQWCHEQNDLGREQVSGEKYQQEDKEGAMAPAGTLQLLQHGASCRTVCMKTHSSACITQEFVLEECVLEVVYYLQLSDPLRHLHNQLRYLFPNWFSSPLSYSSAHSDTLQGFYVTEKGNTIMLFVSPSY